MSLIHSRALGAGATRAGASGGTVLGYASATANANATQVSIAYNAVSSPGGHTTAGNLLIACVIANDQNGTGSDTPAAIGTPSGWSPQAHQDAIAGYLSWAVFTRTATGNSSDTVILKDTGAVTAEWSIAAAMVEVSGSAGAYFATGTNVSNTATPSLGAIGHSGTYLGFFVGAPPVSDALSSWGSFTSIVDAQPAGYRARVSVGKIAGYGGSGTESITYVSALNVGGVGVVV